MARIFSVIAVLTAGFLLTAAPASSPAQSSASPTTLSLTADLVKPTANAAEVSDKSKLILTKVDKGGAELPEGLLAARILFGEGMRKKDGTQLVGLSEEIVKRSTSKVVALPRTNATTQRAAFSQSRELIETLANLGAHKELVTYYETHVAPYEASYKLLPGFGSVIGYVLNSYYAVKRGDFALELCQKLLSDKTIPQVEKSPIAIGEGNNLISKGETADAMLLYKLAITAAPTSPVTAQAFYWVALQTLNDNNNATSTAAAVQLATRGITALGNPVLAWEKELQSKLTEIKNTPRALTGRNAKDLELVPKG